MNFDNHRLLERAIDRQASEDDLATAYVLGDDCGDVLAMLGLGGLS